jgi:hypothetical protein
MTPELTMSYHVSYRIEDTHSWNIIKTMFQHFNILVEILIKIETRAHPTAHNCVVKFY